MRSQKIQKTVPKKAVESGVSAKKILLEEYAGRHTGERVDFPLRPKIFPRRLKKIKNPTPYIFVIPFFIKQEWDITPGITVPILKCYGAKALLKKTNLFELGWKNIHTRLLMQKKSF